jgi:hypothetical protein
VAEQISMIYYGIDMADYPGDATIEFLKAHSKITWIGLYLAHAAGSPATDWSGKLAGIEGGAKPWGTAPLYAAYRDPYPGDHPPRPDTRNAQTGQADGGETLRIAREFGVPSGSRIFLDIEVGGNQPQNALEYIAAWRDAVTYGMPIAGGTNYAAKAGIYCSYTSVNQVHGAVTGLKAWIWDLTVLDGPMSLNIDNPGVPSHVPASATAVQFAQNLSIAKSATGATINADFSISTTKNPRTA